MNDSIILDSKPDDYLISQIREMKKNDAPIAVCVIGLGKSDVSIKITNELGKFDQYYYFDYYSNVDVVKNAIRSSNCVKIGTGHTRKTYDSYGWSLIKLYQNLVDMGNTTQIFDLVLLNGTNVYLHDFIVCSLAKKMLKENGQIVVMNTDWTFRTSRYWNPDKNPVTKDILTDELIDTKQVSVVTSIIFNDESFMKCCGNNYQVFKRVEGGRSS